MIEDYVLWFLTFSAMGTYVMELWSGVAVWGHIGQWTIVMRSESPSWYWFVMLIQTMVGVVSLLLIEEFG